MMNHRKKFLGFILILSLILVNFITGDTAIALATSSNDRRVFDEAGLLTDYEISELELLCQEYGENAGIEIFILTHNDPKATYPERYIEDFEDQLPVGDRVYFLYDVSRKEIFMEGYGLAEIYIHSKRIDNIFDHMEDDIRNKSYYDAFETYINMSADYMSDDSELNYDHDYIYDNPPKDFDSDNQYSYDEYDYDRYYQDERMEENILYNIWFQLFASLVIGGVVVGVMAYNSSGKMTAGSKDYLDCGKSGLIGRRDHYIRSTVTKVRKPSQNTSSRSGGSRGGFNSGGFRGGSSSGGRSHSSGGRKL